MNFREFYNQAQAFYELHISSSYEVIEENGQVSFVLDGTTFLDIPEYDLNDWIDGHFEYDDVYTEDGRLEATEVFERLDKEQFFWMLFKLNLDRK